MTKSHQILARWELRQSLAPSFWIFSHSSILPKLMLINCSNAVIRDYNPLLTNIKAGQVQKRSTKKMLQSNDTDCECPANTNPIIQPSPRLETIESIINKRKQELQCKFSEIDKNGDGFISQDELMHYLQQFGINRCPVVCIDGKMSFLEFTQWMTSDKPNLLQKALNHQLAIPNFSGRWFSLIYV